ncbi:MAG: COR domain-containing protein [Chitinophagales bacterium]
MSQLARQLIAENKRTKAKSLDLGNCGLTDLEKQVPELFECVWLEELWLCNHYWDAEKREWIESKNKTEQKNQLSFIPSIIQQLQKLKTLYIGGDYIGEEWKINDVSSLKTFGQLTTLYLGFTFLKNTNSLKYLQSLQNLYLIANQISDIHFLENLQNLHILNLNGNQISDIRFLENLRNLHTLYLNNNQISNTRFLEGLQNLRILSIGSNQISNIRFLENLQYLHTLDLSNNKIADSTPTLSFVKRGIPITRYWGMNRICIEGNPFTTPPIEIIEEGNQAILNYFEELELQGSEAVYEAKLLIIGEAGAGKTSLKRKIGNCEAALPDEEKDTTTGIEITQHSFAATADLPEFKMNIWDFGGQAVYHATHQFFLSKRSLYVLVDDGRKEDNNSYWMQIQELFGQGSPLLLFMNQKGTIQRQIPLNDLKGEFPNIRELTTLNLKSEAHKIPDYCRTLEFYIRNLPQFKQGETLPKKWVRIREALEAREENHISLSQFRQICRKEGINEAKRQDFLSDYLHDLGVMLHFQDTPLLKRMVVLKPEWATNAVYAILNHTEQTGKDGQFTYAKLDEVWQSHEYQDVFEELLALMQKFELCYRLKHDENRFIVPQLLPKDKPEFEWKNERNLQLRYEYDFMPKGIITRFIVRRHKFIEAQKLVWQRGVVLKYKKARALVVEEYRNKAINIRIEGKFPQDLMSIITDEIDDINSGFHFNERMKVRKIVPCICSACSGSSKPKLYVYDDLIEILEKGRHQYFCNFGGEPFHIMEALRNIGDSGKGKSRYGSRYEEPVFGGEKMPKKVFIAYDDADEAHLEALTKHLKSLQRNGQLQTWSVNQTIAGSNQQEVLDQQLSEAEVVLLLISVDFVNSDTCVEHILEVAMERKAEGLAEVVPIYVEPCDCEGMSFDGLKALPNDKTKEKFVTLWENRQVAWLNVARGVKEVLKA